MLVLLAFQGFFFFFFFLFFLCLVNVQCLFWILVVGAWACVLRANEGCVEETGFLCTGGLGFVDFWFARFRFFLFGQKETKPRNGRETKPRVSSARGPRFCARSLALSRIVFFSFFLFFLCTCSVLDRGCWGLGLRAAGE